MIERLAPLEVSIGDYVLSGGELAAMVLIDAVARLLPGVLGDEHSSRLDSFSIAERPLGLSPKRAPEGAGRRLLDCPHYTKPREWMGQSVPEILFSGDHARIDQWRHQQKLDRTRQRRPDLLTERHTPPDASQDGA